MALEMRSPPDAVIRTDGYAPIRDYGVIGDKRTAALVARDGSIDWMALPTFDGPAVFAALIDSAAGGSFTLCPAVPFTARQAYIEDTNVLQTVFETAEGTVRVTDALALPISRVLPWTQLIRRIEGLSGRVPMRWRVHPRFDDGATDAIVRRRDDAVLFLREPDVLSLQSFGAGDPEVIGSAAEGAFTCAEGAGGALCLNAFHDEPLTFETEDRVRRHLQETCRRWSAWSGGCGYDGPWRTAVTRSALALDLLVDSRTGAIAAAATMGLPERIGGPRNYDYRYAWVRDANLTLEAMLKLGLDEQVHASLAWMLATIRGTHPRLQPMYRLSGSARVPDRHLERPGYRHSRPVTVGNAARDQVQLGSYGDLFQMVLHFVERGGGLAPEGARRLAEIADHVGAIWRCDDAGIWELPEQRPYTQSKLACWVSLDRAARLADRGELDGGRAEAWRRTASVVERYIRERCWSDRAGAYARAAGSDELDAGVLLASRGSFVEDEPERLGATVDAIRDRLGAGRGLVYRASGMDEIEGAFLACSFWVVETLARLGRVDEAAETMEPLLALAGPTGLLSEEVDPATGELLGNLPQALSHLALINAADAVGRAASGTPRAPRAG